MCAIIPQCIHQKLKQESCSPVSPAETCTQTETQWCGPGRTCWWGLQEVQEVQTEGSPAAGSAGSGSVKAQCKPHPGCSEVCGADGYSWVLLHIRYLRKGQDNQQMARSLHLVTIWVILKCVSISSMALDKKKYVLETAASPTWSWIKISEH